MLAAIIEQKVFGMHPFFELRYHFTPIHTTVDERYGLFVRAYMLEIVAIIFIVLTIPLWLPLVTGIVASLLSFGFMAVFWLIFIAAVLYLILT